MFANSTLVYFQSRGMHTPRILCNFFAGLHSSEIIVSLLTGGKPRQIVTIGYFVNVRIH